MPMSDDSNPMPTASQQSIQTEETSWQKARFRRIPIFTSNRQTGPDSASVKMQRERANIPWTKRLLKGIERKWGFLKTQDGFRQAPVLAAIRLVSWLARCSLRKAAVINLRRWNLQMFLPAGWRGFGKYIFAFRDKYEPELVYLQRLLSSGNVFIDVGANMGIYTLVASRLVGETGRVIAFEPSAQSFPLLRKNIALNSLTNVLAFPVAISHETGRTKLYHGPDPVCNSLGMDPSWDGDAEDVVTDSLDNMLQKASLERVDVMKIDVEGAEEFVLRGALKVVKSTRPVIIFEINPGACKCLGLSPHGVPKLLQSLGYKCFVLGERGTACQLDSPPGYFNVIAIPSNWNEHSLGLSQELNMNSGTEPESSSDPAEQYAVSADEDN
jgi:FkbM family methyltransferase